MDTLNSRLLFQDNKSSILVHMLDNFADMSQKLTAKKPVKTGCYVLLDKRLKNSYVRTKI